MSAYTLPARHLLAPVSSFGATSEPTQEQIIVDTLSLARVGVSKVEPEQGASVTRYRIRLDAGIAPEKVRSQESTLAVATGRVVRYAGVDGCDVLLEVAREARTIVTLRDSLEDALDMGEALPFVVGQDVAGTTVTADLASTVHPHLLVAGSTGSGKSEFLNALITGLVMVRTPDDLRFVMIDPKRVELAAFENLPHLDRPIVTSVPEAIAALKDVAAMMDYRYQVFADLGVKSIGEYNSAVAHSDVSLTHEHMPYVVVVIDELADLITGSKATEALLVRLGQLARAAGIHLVLATQRPAADTVPKRLTLNIPGRVAFRVTDSVASRIALAEGGAEKLMGKGDGLWKATGSDVPTRFQSPFVTRPEIDRIVKFWHNQAIVVAPVEPIVAPDTAERDAEEQAERDALENAEWAAPEDAVYIHPSTIVAEAGISPEVLAALTALVTESVTETLVRTLHEIANNEGA